MQAEQESQEELSAPKVIEKKMNRLEEVRREEEEGGRLSVLLGEQSDERKNCIDINVGIVSPSIPPAISKKRGSTRGTVSSSDSKSKNDKLRKLENISSPTTFSSSTSFPSSSSSTSFSASLESMNEKNQCNGTSNNIYEKNDDSKAFDVLFSAATSLASPNTVNSINMNKTRKSKRGEERNNINNVTSQMTYDKNDSVEKGKSNKMKIIDEHDSNTINYEMPTKKSRALRGNLKLNLDEKGNEKKETNRRGDKKGNDKMESDEEGRQGEGEEEEKRTGNDVENVRRKEENESCGMNDKAEIESAQSVIEVNDKIICKNNTKGGKDKIKGKGIQNASNIDKCSVRANLSESMDIVPASTSVSATNAVTIATVTVTTATASGDDDSGSLPLTYPVDILPPSKSTSKISKQNKNKKNAPKSVLENIHEDNDIKDYYDDAKSVKNSKENGKFDNEKPKLTESLRRKQKGEEEKSQKIVENKEIDGEEMNEKIVEKEKEKESEVQIMNTGVTFKKGEFEQFACDIGGAVAEGPHTATHLITLNFIKRTPKVIDSRFNYIKLDNKKINLKSNTILLI